MVDLPIPRSPRSPFSPRSPGSAREVALELDDAFSLADNDQEMFTASSLPTRAELQRMAGGTLWHDDGGDGELDSQYTLDSAHDTLTLQLPPSPISFRRSYSPTLSPTLHASELEPVPAPEPELNQLELTLDAVDLQDAPAPPVFDIQVASQDEPEPAPGPEPSPEHPYPTIHIDVAHRTVKSISSISEESQSSPHGSGHNVSASLSSSSEPQPPRQSSVELPASTSRAAQSPQSTSTPTKRNAASPRVTVSHGPSALEKVLSKTRPSYLPPKNKEEDTKHLKDWEDMMRKSRVAEEKRAALVAERRRAREAAVEASIPIWEREIVPDWRVASRDTRLRGLWWNGIPSNLRGQLWERAIGNDIALSKDSFARCSARGRRARESGVSPLDPSTMAAIEEDVSTTFPSLHVFLAPTGPLYEDLRDILCAFMIARSDEGVTHYTHGTARTAAMLLLNLAPDKAFIALRNLLERHCLRSFYGGPALKDDVDAYYRIFDTLLADCMPKVYFNFKQHQISPSVYLADWIIPLFVDHLPVEACARVWDGIVLHGDAFLFRVALALLNNIEMRLFFPDRKELLEVLRGENRAAQEVARRAGLLALEPEGAGRYAQYGVDEESVWQRIVEMDDWWKESTWTRLLQRELPDL